MLHFESYASSTVSASSCWAGKVLVCSVREQLYQFIWGTNDPDHDVSGCFIKCVRLYLSSLWWL